MADVLTPAQIETFHDQGFLVLEGTFPESALDRVGDAVLRNAKQIVTPNGRRYPDRETQFTLIGSDVADPDLAFIAEHETIIGAAAQLLEAPPVLSAFVTYLKTPGAAGTSTDYQNTGGTAHCDYKTYQHAGSSLRWLFGITPLADLDERTGPLMVSPGSHRLSRIEDAGHGVRRVARASAPDIAPRVDAKLRRGDLLLMHGFTWHEGRPNRSDHDRLGLYNKYRAANAPPAAGPNLFSNAAHAAFSPSGRSLLPHHGDRPIGRCRLLLEHDGRLLLLRAAGDAGWSLPGGPVINADRTRGSDEGNLIASIEDAAADNLGVEVPWATYIGDYDEDDAICRVYAHATSDTPTPNPSGGSRAEWFTFDQVRQMDGDLACGFERDALDRWLDRSIVRGIGQSKRRAAPNRA